MWDAGCERNTARSQTLRPWFMDAHRVHRRDTSPLVALQALQLMPLHAHRRPHVRQLGHELVQRARDLFRLIDRYTAGRHTAAAALGSAAAEAAALHTLDTLEDFAYFWRARADAR